MKCHFRKQQKCIHKNSCDVLYAIFHVDLKFLIYYFHLCQFLHYCIKIRGTRTVKFIMTNYTQIKLFLIIISSSSQYIINLTKIIIKHFNSKKCIYSNWVYYLLNTYIMHTLCFDFESNLVIGMNWFIYIRLSLDAITLKDFLLTINKILFF